jgi:hypothetical protein
MHTALNKNDFKLTILCKIIKIYFVNNLLKYCFISQIVCLNLQC